MNQEINQSNLTTISTQNLPQIVVSATFTIDNIYSSLNFMLESAGTPVNLHIAPYNQVFQQLLDPASESSQNSHSLNIFVIRLEDFVRDFAQNNEVLQHLKKTLAELLDALTQFAKKSTSFTIIAVLPCSPKIFGELKVELNNASARLEASLKTMPNVVLLSIENLDNASFDTEIGYDAISDDLAHVPYDEVSFAALALAIARKVHLLRVPARKVLVLDCDNTIWRGVVGEDGVEGISLPPAFLQIQQFAMHLQTQGVLICLASKNAEQDVLEVFEKRTDMLLKIEHIVAHRINWQSKYLNLQSLASELNLGLDSFVFLDDNPVECGQMRQMLPMVTTLQVPADDDVGAFLAHLWTFDKLAVTEEDTKRTQMYKENNARQNVEDSATDIGAFLASLELVIDIDQPEQDEWPRIAQLTQRTNQFNFTTVRRNEPDIRAVAARSDAYVLRVKVRDRFGDYGLVGLAIGLINHDALQIDTLLLSCRVLGRGVEHAILRYLGEIAIKHTLTWLELPYLLTPKNEPARAFADNVAIDFKTSDGLSVIYRIPADFAVTITHAPGSDPEAVMDAKRNDGKKKIASLDVADPIVSSSQCYEKLAKQLTSGDKVLAAMQSVSMRKRSLDTNVIAPNSPIEHELLAMWQHLLGIEGLGVEDDYFAIGGTSLIAARLFAEIARRYDVRLRLTTILDAPTIRLLARYIQPNQAAGHDVLVTLKTGILKPDTGRKLFLVHDGDGETLLYRNLAARMPATLAVVGIEPLSKPGIPMAHDSIEAMAAFYVQTMRQKQPQGPYLLGGMCAGGLIAYVMGVQLLRAGEQVDLVAILDAATPKALKRAGLITNARSKRVSGMLAEAEKLTGIGRVFYIAKALTKKVLNAVRWEMYSRSSVTSARIRFYVLKLILANHTTWPNWLPQLSVRNIYNAAEADCVLVPEPKLNVLLIRAIAGNNDDQPYREIYADDTFGWRELAPQLTVTDVAGGHASMLQEPYVESLADALIEHGKFDNNAQYNE